MHGFCGLLDREFFLVLADGHSRVIPGWSARTRVYPSSAISVSRSATADLDGPDPRCAIAHRGIPRFRVRSFPSRPLDVQLHIRAIAHPRMTRRELVA